MITMDFKVGDLVRIVSQPRGYAPSCVGRRAFIDEMFEMGTEYASVAVQCIDSSGKATLWGRLSPSCLEREENEEWKAALKANRDTQKQFEARLFAYGARRKAEIEAVAKHYGVTPENALAIYDEISAFEDEEAGR